MIYVLILTVISTVGLLFAVYGIKSNLTSPLSLHSFAWCLVSIVGLFAYDEFDEFPEISFYALLTWYLIVYLILLVGETLVINTDSKEKYRGKTYHCSRYWIFIIPVSLYCIYEIYKVGTGGPASFFLNLRLSNILDDYTGVKFTILTAIYPVMIAMFAIIFFCNSSKINKYAILLWVTLYCIGTMGKFAIVTPVIVFLVIQEMKAGLNKKKLLFASPFLVLGILVLHFVRMTNDDSSTLSSVLGLYIYSPILALGKISDLGFISYSGDYTFRFIFALLYKLGFSSEEPVKTILDYVDVPVPTNVYTVMQPFFQDYFLYGVAFGAVLYGLIFSWIYLYVKRGSSFALLIYALLAVGIFTSFLTETLITNLSGNIKLIICVYILWRLTVKCETKQ